MTRIGENIPNIPQATQNAPSSSQGGCISEEPSSSVFDGAKQGCLVEDGTITPEAQKKIEEMLKALDGANQGSIIEEGTLTPEAQKKIEEMLQKALDESQSEQSDKGFIGKTFDLIKDIDSEDGDLKKTLDGAKQGCLVEEDGTLTPEAQKKIEEYRSEHPGDLVNVKATATEIEIKKAIEELRRSKHPTDLSDVDVFYRAKYGNVKPMQNPTPEGGLIKILIDTFKEIEQHPEWIYNSTENKSI